MRWGWRSLRLGFQIGTPTSHHAHTELREKKTECVEGGGFGNYFLVPKQKHKQQKKKLVKLDFTKLNSFM